MATDIKILSESKRLGWKTSFQLAKHFGQESKADRAVFREQLSELVSDGAMIKAYFLLGQGRVQGQLVLRLRGECQSGGMADLELRQVRAQVQVELLKWTFKVPADADLATCRK